MSRSIDEILSKLDQEDRDILQDKLNALEASDKKKTTLIERSPICTKIIDLERRLHYMSCAGVTALKIPDITDFYNKYYPPIGFSQVLSDLYDEHFPIALSGQATVFECPIPDMEGHEEWFITHLIPIKKDDSDELDFILASSAIITDRKNAEEEAAELHKKLLKTSRAAGMEEVATGILHNVGNALSSVSVSTELIANTARRSKAASLTKTLGLIDDHEGNLDEYLRQDAKGQKIVPYLKELAAQLEKDQQVLTEETKLLKERVQHISVVVGRQQKYAKHIAVIEQCSVSELIKEAVSLVEDVCKERSIELIVNNEVEIDVAVDRHMAVQVLVNLLSNAKHALIDAKEQTKKEIYIDAKVNNDERFFVRVRDNGVGIPEDNAEKIFRFGFTTKENGHGFGLHNASNTAKALGGSLTFHSDGPGCGAIFSLELPINGEKATQSGSLDAVVAVQE